MTKDLEVKVEEGHLNPDSGASVEDFIDEFVKTIQFRGEAFSGGIYEVHRFGDWDRIKEWGVVYHAGNSTLVLSLKARDDNGKKRDYLRAEVYSLIGEDVKNIHDYLGKRFNEFTKPKQS